MRRMGCKLRLLQRPREHQYHRRELGNPQGISAGNGGTLIASGTTVTPVVTPTGRSGFGFIEFMVEVTGLNVHLAGAGANYHLNVTPIGNLDGNRAFDSTTSGANCIGTPCGDNDNAFLDSSLFGAVFEPVADFGSNSVTSRWV